MRGADESDARFAVPRRDSGVERRQIDERTGQGRQHVGHAAAFGDDLKIVAERHGDVAAERRAISDVAERHPAEPGNLTILSKCRGRKHEQCARERGRDESSSHLQYLMTAAMLAAATSTRIATVMPEPGARKCSRKLARLTRLTSCVDDSSMEAGIGVAIADQGFENIESRSKVLSDSGTRIPDPGSRYNSSIRPPAPAH